MGLGGWNHQHSPELDPGKLPATLVDHPVVAVAEQDQVGH